MAKDVIVVVQRDTLPKEKENLDILLVSTTGERPVEVYRDIQSVEAVYGPDGPCPNSKIVRKAATLLNQGKTTLATTLVSKFKIVDFEPPSGSPALPASLILNFTDVEFDGESIPEDTALCVKIGGDDKAIVEVTTTESIASPAQFAALFEGTNFTKGGKTYTAAVEGGTVIYTATVPCAADTIPKRLNIYADEIMSREITLTPLLKIDFANDVNELSSADSLVETIKKFQTDVDNDWYYLMTGKDDDDYVAALAKFAEASKPTGSGTWRRHRESPQVLHGADYEQKIRLTDCPRRSHLHGPGVHQ